MKVYEGKSIRNVCFVGHGGTGKTSLISAALFASGATNRLGSVRRRKRTDRLRRGRDRTQNDHFYKDGIL